MGSGPGPRPWGDRRRDAILAFVEDYWRVHGQGPTYPEIGEAVGLRATSVHYQITVLADAGCVTYTPRLPRSVRVVDTDEPC